MPDRTFLVFGIGGKMVDVGGGLKCKADEQFRKIDPGIEVGDDGVDVIGDS